MEKETPKELDFKPLSSGLGFHPFSDGLPYAPLSKSPGQAKPAQNLTNGTGAISAGAPRFAATLPATIKVPVAQPAPQTLVQTAAQAAAKAAAPSTVQERLSASEQRLGWGYVFKRVLAWTLDSVLNTVICFAALSMALWNQNLAPELLLNPGTLMVSALFFAAFSWALVTAQEIAFGTTLGKRLFGLRLDGTTSAIFLRAFFFLPSMGFAGAGLLWSLVDRRKRCWHDLIFDLQPIES